MNIRRIALAAASAAVLALGLAACDSGSTNQGQALEDQQQNNDSLTYDQAQPIPHFAYSQERATLTEVEAIEALGSQTTSFFFNQGVTDPIFSCPSLGMPVASTASLSNPDQIVNPSNGNNGNNSVTVGQMDPNGIYNPPDSTGTNVICLNSAGQPYVNYWEGYVESISGAATWNSATHQMEVTGQPTIPKCVLAGSGSKRQTVCTKK